MPSTNTCPVCLHGRDEHGFGGCWSCSDCTQTRESAWLEPEKPGTSPSRLDRIECHHWCDQARNILEDFLRDLYAWDRWPEGYLSRDQWAAGLDDVMQSVTRAQKAL